MQPHRAWRGPRAIVFVAATSVIALTASVVSCARAAAPPQSSMASAQVLASKADVIITDVSSPEDVTALVGQTIGIVWPGGNGTWQVDFPPDELILLTARGALAAPGPAGWVWRAAKAGDVEITLTSRLPCPNPPCAENPIKYTIRLRLQTR